MNCWYVIYSWGVSLDLIIQTLRKWKWHCCTGEVTQSHMWEEKKKENHRMTNGRLSYYKGLTWINIDKTKWLFVNGTVCDWAVANIAVLCNRQSRYTCRRSLPFAFSEALFPLNRLPHVCHLFVHLLKIKEQLTVWGSFQCGRAERQPFSISKYGFVCSGLCVFCLFLFFFHFYPPRPPPCAIRSTSSKRVCSKKTTNIIHQWIVLVFPDAVFPYCNFSKNNSSWSLSWDFETFRLVLFLPSHPNALVGIPYSTTYSQCNTEMSFSFTPLSQTLPYKYRQENKRFWIYVPHQSR